MQTQPDLRPDRQTDLVFISDLLRSRHHSVAQALHAALGDRLQTIPGTKDIWCRDYMPVQVSRDRFVQFRYDPDYLKQDQHLRTEDGAGQLDLTRLCERSPLLIDGGNVVRGNEAAILTDKIYRENPSVGHPKLREKVGRLLEVERLMVIPREPGDAIGHADGMVRFVDEKTVLVNDYTRVNRAFGTRFAASLRQCGFEMIPFPYSPMGQRVDGIDSAVGVYINFLQIGGMIIFPTFGQTEDDQAMKILIGCFPGHQIIPVQCNELAAEGGVLNCVTWDIQTEGGLKYR